MDSELTHSSGDKESRAPRVSARVARANSDRMVYVDAASQMPLLPDGSLDTAWTFDYVHLTNEMYDRYGAARGMKQPRAHQ